MKKRFLWLFLGLILVATFAGAVWPGEGKGPCTIMHPDRETLQRWIQDYKSAPKAYIDKTLKLSIPLKGSLSLLSHLKYTPSERNQGSCGNCWAWAGTGVMAIALDVEEDIFDRLSVQYINSCGGTGLSYACCGGWLSDVADYYTSAGQAIPWSNTNASWQDVTKECYNGSSDVSCYSISTSPNYSIGSIEEQAIETQGVGQAQAIANIKNVLNQGKAVWFGYFLATGDDWTNFLNFWNNEGEEVTWNPDFSCGHTWIEGEGGGHAVLCVGYNDNDPDNSYWIMVNSWGTAGGDRENGIFRLDMDMDYDCIFYDMGRAYYSFYWQTLDIKYGAPGLAPTVTTNPATSVTSDSAQLNGTVNPNGKSTTYYFEYGTTKSYGSHTVTSNAGSGTNNVSVSATITGLSPNTIYHYRIVATNNGGTSYGRDRTFHTSASALPPAVTTDSATSVTSDSATLIGTVNPNGETTTYCFEYWATGTYRLRTATNSAGSGTSEVSVSATITGLKPNITYHYWLVAINSGGTSYGSVQAFTTELKSMPWLKLLLPSSRNHK